MPDCCANPSCSVPRYPNQGKLFCAEIEIGSATCAAHRTTAHVWLCDGCARQMTPDSEVAGDIVRALLAQSYPSCTPQSSAVN